MSTHTFNLDNAELQQPLKKTCNQFDQPVIFQIRNSSVVRLRCPQLVVVTTVSAIGETISFYSGTSCKNDELWGDEDEQRKNFEFGKFTGVEKNEQNKAKDAALYDTLSVFRFAL